MNNRQLTPAAFLSLPQLRGELKAVSVFTIAKKDAYPLSFRQILLYFPILNFSSPTVVQSVFLLDFAIKLLVSGFGRTDLIRSTEHFRNIYNFCGIVHKWMPLFGAIKRDQRLQREWDLQPHSRAQIPTYALGNYSLPSNPQKCLPKEENQVKHLLGNSSIKPNKLLKFYSQLFLQFIGRNFPKTIFYNFPLINVFFHGKLFTFSQIVRWESYN